MTQGKVMRAQSGASRRQAGNFKGRAVLKTYINETWSIDISKTFKN